MRVTKFKKSIYFVCAISLGGSQAIASESPSRIVNPTEASAIARALELELSGDPGAKGKPKVTAQAQAQAQAQARSHPQAQCLALRKNAACTISSSVRGCAGVHRNGPGA